MVSHLSAVKEVLELSAHDVLVLEKHYEHFPHDQARWFAEFSWKLMKKIHLNLRQALPSLRGSTAAIRRILTLSLLVLLTGAPFTS